MVIFGDAYCDRRIFVTGATGFKGSWLCEWLLQLGAQVYGLSLPASTEPNHWELLGLEKRIQHFTADIRDAEAVAHILNDVQPQVVFHLAAQPLVRHSYAKPAETWSTNAMGTVNLLEAIRHCASVKACVVVTSDKCYEVREAGTVFKETDSMGGHDPYSASKGAAEIIAASYRRSFFSDADSCQLATARSGNVMGGGDWAADRIVVDLVKAITTNRSLVIRKPGAIRPWQHVLEPLSGYLHLGECLLRNHDQKYADAWNFGPDHGDTVTVLELANQIIEKWGRGQIEMIGDSADLHETDALRLCCDKARDELGWTGVWRLEETIKKTVDWYQSWHSGASVADITRSQINSYCWDAQREQLVWISSTSGEAESLARREQEHPNQ